MKKYQNQIPTVMNMGIRSMFSMLRDSLSGRAGRRPAASIDARAFKQAESITASDAPRVTWFGHSAFYLEMEGKRLLFDPMFGSRPSPVSWAGTKRYTRSFPVQPDDFVELDAIIISHDHYDHLDYLSIRQLKDKTPRLIVPMGVRQHLIKWGVPSEKITEHNWWDELKLDGLTLACTPARHFSGRGLFNRDSTLWCSWVIAGRETKVFYSGDSGYGPHFKEIGEKYGPFHLTLLECGQYDERWSAIHMMPEQTVQAHLDLGGNLLIPVHWGAFTLAFHSWTDPAERVTKAARKHQIDISTPRIGETVLFASGQYPNTSWWG
ncbi:L-ascorbate metabolism protein UlaG, beta-lactamase superfamily [Bacillus sp. OV322]|uniref:MBL fold metallo-hydrolase n=1 Tax=Bacillus sp. OV322 TaxID=1882764 RepID=UPI0008F3139C|nr:MBL fold metallo-hydrolase [Bacillus sp. OV322]SFC91293.1 L-ascorbate metabolism protein UlaG, beta-lactamase superfamily [Bacillus sp. OV322]